MELELGMRDLHEAKAATTPAMAPTSIKNLLDQHQPMVYIDLHDTLELLLSMPATKMKLPTSRLQLFTNLLGIPLGPR